MSQFAPPARPDRAAPVMAAAAPPMPIATHARETLALGLPLIGSSIAQFALHVVNTIMVGWYGVIPLAALVLGAASFFILFVLGSGFAKAVMPLAANARAKGNEQELRRAARMGLWLSVGFALLVLPVFLNAGTILLALGQKPEVAAEAQRYLRIAGLGMGPALVVAVLQSWLAALGRTQVVLWVTLLAVALNALFNWALIFGNWGAPELGVAGAASSSLIVQLISVLVLSLYAGFAPGLRPYLLFRRFWRIDLPALREVVRLGVPIGLTGLAEAGLFHASALMMGWIGAVELAAHGIALEAAALAFMVHVGLSSAVTIRVAAFDGRGQVQELRDAAKVALVISLLVAVVVIGLFVSKPAWVIGLFLDARRADSGAIIGFGVTLLMLAALFQLADAMQAMALGLLRGIQDTRAPMFLAAISYWVIGIPSGYGLAFGLGLGGVGLWLGLVIGLSVASILLLWRFWSLAPKVGVAGEAAL